VPDLVCVWLWVYWRNACARIRFLWIPRGYKVWVTRSERVPY
jgi:hypothetical protein